MIIRGQELSIDIEEEIEDIEFKHKKIRGEKLQACSPFRDEYKPSFAINLENGLWVDSGATADHLKKGNLISFLANIRGVSYEEIEEYLIEKYAVDFTDTTKLQLKINLNKGKELYIKKIKFSAEYSYSRYLDKIRGIDECVQILFKTSETKKDDMKVVAIPWYDKNGNLLNIKYRSVTDKKFFYEEDGASIKPHLFGLDKVRNIKPKELWIVESEIDAMYLWSCGFYAVAIGRASINNSQLKLIKSLGVEKVVIATDNDAVGRNVADVLVGELMPHFKVYMFEFPSGKKDINDLPKNVIKGIKMSLCKITLKCKI